ncbi:MAG: ABC transporter permease, partial [Bacteroidota bacterium]
MLKNYLITILRQIQKNKVFSFINIFGLALGMAACLVIAQYVNFHTSFDKYHSNADQVFRIEGDAYKNGETLGPSIYTPSMLSQTLMEQSRNVSAVARFFDINYTNNSIIYNDGENQVNFEQGKSYVTEKGAFELFDFEFVAGSAQKFDEPQKAILTLGASKKYFSDPQKAIGSSFVLSGNTGATEYELVGVMKDLPPNSHFDFELLLSLPSLDKYSPARTRWDYNSMVAYIMLDDPSSLESVLANTQDLYAENMKEVFAHNGYQVEYKLRSLTDIHTDQASAGMFTSPIDGKLILILSLIAIVILVIAWINYMNLSLIRTMERLKEMGIRKCMGSSMKQLTQLFVMEAFVMNSIAFGLALLITQAGEAYLIEITGLPISALMNMEMLSLLGGIMLAGTLLIGFYPYALLKTMSIVNVLVGKKGKVGGGKLRKSLVFAQFVITFILIAGTITIYNQI